MTSITLYVGKQTIAAIETPLGEHKDSGPIAERYAELVARLWQDAVEGDDARKLITAAAGPLNRIFHGRK